MDAYTEIKNKIRAMQGQRIPLLLTGKVESVDGETCTVSVGDLKLTGVRLRSVVNGEASKLLITPKTGSYVTVIDLSGELRETEAIFNPSYRSFLQALHAAFRAGGGTRTQGHEPVELIRLTPITKPQRLSSLGL
ncbi:MAG: hypothetical protein IKU00_00145 [Bacteroidales bacterium]|nr:hypothetical protein [Bacteroidales bacterium]